eukprot:6177195-Pleurochrysis_carterae.AAC.1
MDEKHGMRSIHRTLMRSSRRRHFASAQVTSSASQCVCSITLRRICRRYPFGSTGTLTGLAFPPIDYARA